MFKIYTLSAKFSQTYGKIRCDVIGGWGAEQSAEPGFWDRIILVDWGGNPPLRKFAAWGTRGKGKRGRNGKENWRKRKISKRKTKWQRNEKEEKIGN